MLKYFNWHFSISLFLEYPLSVAAVCYLKAVSRYSQWVIVSMDAAHLTKVLRKYRFWMYIYCGIDSTLCSLHLKVKIQYKHNAPLSK